MLWNYGYGSTSGFEGSPLINGVAIASHSDSYNLFVRDMVTLTRGLSLTASLSYTRSHVSLGGTNATI